MWVGVGGLEREGEEEREVGSQGGAAYFRQHLGLVKPGRGREGRWRGRGRQREGRMIRWWVVVGGGGLLKQDQEAAE